MARGQVREWGQTALALLFPPRCAVCDGLLAPEELAHGIHGGCAGKLIPVGEHYCMHCGRPLDVKEREYCYDCARRQSPDGRPFSYFVQGRAVFEYRGEAKTMMYRFKYSNRREYAAFLADAACERWGRWIAANGVEAVVAVPMYRGKERRRGYNQAALFARALAEREGLSFLPGAVLRTRNTKPQKGLNDGERKNNLKNAFHFSHFIVQYKKVLLVDDIYTTGSTAEAVAEQLAHAGLEVYFLAACIGRGF